MALKLDDFGPRADVSSPPRDPCEDAVPVFSSKASPVQSLDEWDIEASARQSLDPLDSEASPVKPGRQKIDPLDIEVITTSHSLSPDEGDQGTRMIVSLSGPMPDPTMPVEVKRRRPNSVVKIKSWEELPSYRSDPMLDRPEFGEHPVAQCTLLMNSVRLIRAEDFLKLTPPIKRCQDIPEGCSGVPSGSDVLVAISHAWRNAAHPDPNGRKHQVICSMLEEIIASTASQVYVFMDYISMPQRPSSEGEPPRTEEERSTFNTALEEMHLLYFAADLIIHLDVEEQILPGEGALHRLPLEDLRGAELARIADWLQIVGPAPPCDAQPDLQQPEQQLEQQQQQQEKQEKHHHQQLQHLQQLQQKLPSLSPSLPSRSPSPESLPPPPPPMPSRFHRLFDRIIAIDDVPIEDYFGDKRKPDRSSSHSPKRRKESAQSSSDDPADAKRNSVSSATSNTSYDSAASSNAEFPSNDDEPWRQVFSDTSVDLYPDSTVDVRRYPFGRVNEIPADERGWVFLERFLCAVKCSMLEPHVAKQVVLSNSPQITEQILDIAATFRGAANEDNRARSLECLASSNCCSDGRCPTNGSDNSRDIIVPLASRHTSRHSTLTLAGLQPMREEDSDSTNSEEDGVNSTDTAVDLDLEAISVPPNNFRREFSPLSPGTPLTSTMLSFSDQPTKRRLSASDVISRLSSNGSRRSAEDGFRNLEVVLKHYLEVLATKRFSGASTDTLCSAQGEDSGYVEDREIVGQIMQQFVGHLGEHWYTELEKQRQRQELLGSIMKASSKYVFEWGVMTPLQLQKLTEASSSDPSPILLLYVLTLLPSLIMLLYPFPDVSMNWEAQVEFLLWFDLCMVMIASLMPVFAVYVTGIPRTRALFCKLLGWTIVVSQCITAVICVTAWNADTYPVPHLHSIAAGTATLLLPSMILCFPKQWRDNRALLRRFVIGLSSLGAIIFTIFGAFPLLAEALDNTDSVLVQCLIIITFLVCKLTFEWMGSRVSSVLGADVMPLFTFQVALGFEMQVCVCLGTGLHILPFLELMLIDSMENVIHLWALYREWTTHRPSFASDLRQHYIAVLLLVREFVEVSAVLCFWACAELARHYNRSQSSFVCGMSDTEFQRMSTFLLVSLAVQLVVFSLTAMILRRKSFRPLQLIRAAVSVYWHPFCCMAVGFTLVCWSTQHIHIIGDVCENL